MKLYKLKIQSKSLFVKVDLNSNYSLINGFRISSKSKYKNRKIKQKKFLKNCLERSCESGRIYFINNYIFIYYLLFI